MTRRTPSTARVGTFTRIAGSHDNEVHAAGSAPLSILRSVMIVVLGVVVGGMMIAMYLPIFDMINAVQ